LSAASFFKIFGAKLVLTEGAKGIARAIEKSRGVGEIHTQ